MFSGFLPAGLIPLFIEAQKIGTYNSRIGYLIMTSLTGAGFFFFVGYIKTIPREMDEAAALDGCGYIRYIFTMVVPQMKPALATFGIFGFVAGWNNLILPLVMLNDQSLWPVTRGLFSFFGQYSSQWPLVAAATIIVALPILAVFALLQRNLVEGVAGGAAAGSWRRGSDNVRTRRRIVHELHRPSTLWWSAVAGTATSRSPRATSTRPSSRTTVTTSRFPTPWTATSTRTCWPAPI